MLYHRGKILAKGEQLPDDWPVSGTTGYEFIASLAEVLVDDEQIDNLRQAYETVKGAPVDMRAELRAAKLLMVDRNFEGIYPAARACAVDCQRATDRTGRERRSAGVTRVINCLSRISHLRHGRSATADRYLPVTPYCGTGKDA